MKLEDLTTIDQLVDFLAGTQEVAFSVISDKNSCYRWIQGELVKFRYLGLARQGKGVVIPIWRHATETRSANMPLFSSVR